MTTRRASPGKGANPKPAHRRGTYHVDSRRITATARANPATTCWRCGRTLAQHPPHRNGRPAFWTAGHIVDGQPGGVMLPEASTCNFKAGAPLSRTAHTVGKGKARMGARSTGPHPPATPRSRVW